MQPKVSIIFISDNVEEHIKRAIDGLLRQTSADFELLVLDKGGRDASWFVAKQYEDARIKRVSAEGLEDRQAVMKAALSAEGDYIAFCHAMDAWSDDKLEKQTRWLEARPDYAAVFSLIRYSDDSGKPAAVKNPLLIEENGTRFEWLRRYFFKSYGLDLFTALIDARHARESYVKYDANAFYEKTSWVTTFLKADIHILQERLITRNYWYSQKVVRDGFTCALDANVLESYRSLGSLEDWLTVFPELSAYVVRQEFNPDYAFARFCLERLKSSSSTLFALNLLSYLLSGDAKTREQVRRLYGFDEQALEALKKDYSFSPVFENSSYTASLYGKKSGCGAWELLAESRYSVNPDGQYTVQFFVEAGESESCEGFEYLFFPFKDKGVLVSPRHKIFSCSVGDEDPGGIGLVMDEGDDEPLPTPSFLLRFPQAVMARAIKFEGDKALLTARGEITPIKYSECMEVADDRLEAYRLETKRHKQKIRSLQKSFSWKLTAPLRYFSSKLRLGFFIRKTKKVFTILRTEGFVAFSDRLLLYISNSFFGFIKERVEVPVISYEEEKSIDASSTDIKLIAYHLPQFHSFPENDEWWGKGFTEWTNVRRSKPQYPGHIQPEEPHESIGCYNLLDPEAMRKQITLAKKHGVYGFCFHHYWFSGKRLMEKPVDMLLADPTLDIPFCLSWANENWTRRWDGQEHEMLIAQKHSAEDDIAFMEDLVRYFKDPRYIRIDGRPLFQVYHAKILPNIRATLERWRRTCYRLGEAEPFFVMAQSFENYDPRESGFDAASQFPPHNPKGKGFKAVRVKGLSPKFKGRLLAYEDFITETTSKYTQEFSLFPGLCPAWDNTPRRMERAQILLGATPKLYGRWLKKACEFVYATQPPDRRFVFINAWNEWAEGAHLEPSKALGYACLNETSLVLSSHEKKRPFSLGKNSAEFFDKKSRLKVLFVGHNACLAGAQALLLSQLRWLKEHTLVESFLLLLEGRGLYGALTQMFTACAPTMVLNGESLDLNALEGFCGGKPDLIFGNTVVAADLYEEFSQWDVPIVTYVHELESSLRLYASSKTLNSLRQYSKRVICASDVVCQNLVSSREVDKDVCLVVNAFKDFKRERVDDKEKERLRKELGLPLGGRLVLACGTQSLRKGIDLFINMVEEIGSSVKGEKPVFCWVGALDTEELPPSEIARIRKYSDQIIFPGETLSPDQYFQAADIFVLSSREDPFPLVCLEAAQRALPVVCFSDTGDIPCFVGEDGGFVVPHGDVKAMAQACVKLLEDKALRARLGRRLQEKFLEGYTTDSALPRILNVMREVAKKPHPVSVIVPNYNYAKFLDVRLESIVNQRFRDMEIILLDDASVDGSLSCLEKWRKRTGARLIVNERNSGSVVQQWKKGLEHAQGEFVWIAEADDACSNDFLWSLLKAFQDPSVTIAYALPKIIDENGVEQKADYRSSYLSFASESRWEKSYSTPGKEEIFSALAIVNTIPNVSAVVFRSSLGFKAIDAALSFSCSGDWMFYIQLAGLGNVAYVHDAEAWHRRHSQSVVGKDQKKKYQFLAEEASRIHEFVKNKYALPETTRMKMDSFIQSLA